MGPFWLFGGPWETVGVTGRTMAAAGGDTIWKPHFESSLGTEALHFCLGARFQVTFCIDFESTSGCIGLEARFSNGRYCTNQKTTETECS